MAKHRFNPHQLSISFEKATLPAEPMSAEYTAIVQGHLPPPVLPEIQKTTPSVPSANAVAEKKSDLSELHWTSPDGTDDTPIAKPLPQAIENGVFGVDENGEPIDPSPEEVLAITLHHGERLTELLESVRHLDGLLALRSSPNREELLREKERAWTQAKSIVALYAEDFGDTAARHFESWAARQLQSDSQEGEAAKAKFTKQKSEEPSTTPPPEKPEVEPRTRPKKRAPAPNGKLEKLHEAVDRALDQLAESLEAGKSEQLVSWLKTMSRFHDYSFGNQMLIAWQKPDATRVAGFHAWKRFNRLVSKGEKGIMILAPITKVVAKREETDDQGKKKETTTRRIVNTKVVYVFDISQTHGEPLPELSQVSGDPAEHLQNIKHFIASKNIELRYADRLPNDAQGNSQGGRIGCKNGLPPAEEFRTLVHETAHELLHRGERRQATTVRSRELEAESVAFVVCNAIGLDARQTSSDYIHLFRGNKQMLAESMQFIRHVSNEILQHLKPEPLHQFVRE